jgi:hypothetical protein
VAASVTDIFCNLYFVKNHKNAQNWTTTDGGEKISSFEQLQF